jgi:integrase
MQRLHLKCGFCRPTTAAGLRIPRRCQPGRDLRPLAEEEVNRYLEVFDLREKSIARLAIFEGMRPGEIMALRWKPVAVEVIRVVERVYRNPNAAQRERIGLNGVNGVTRNRRAVPNNT